MRLGIAIACLASPAFASLEAPFSMTQCDMVLESALCLSGGKKIIVPDAVPRGLVAHYTFDDAIGLDSSGNHNHASSVPAYQTGLNGVGASALLQDGTFVSIPHSKSYGDEGEFSVSFWFNAIQAPSGSSGSSWCPLLHKGEKDATTKAPQLAINTKTRGLKLTISTDDSSSAAKEGESLESWAAVPLNRWVHVAVTYKERSAKLFVNGILDSSFTTNGEFVPNDGDLYLGGVPWIKEGCDFEILIDELKFYNRAVTVDEIQAEAAPALSGVEPAFVSLGCAECTFSAAVKKCSDTKGYHMCTTMDLHTGGYVVARVNGYADYKTVIFAEGYEGAEEAKGLGLCCVN